MALIVKPGYLSIAFQLSVGSSQRSEPASELSEPLAQLAVEATSMAEEIQTTGLVQAVFDVEPPAPPLTPACQPENAPPSDEVGGQVLASLFPSLERPFAAGWTAPRRGFDGAASRSE